MTKETGRRRVAFKGLNKRARLFVLPLLVFISLGVFGLAIFTIVIMPRINPGSQSGVGADGFTAFVEQNGDMGMGNVVSKDEVVKDLGNKAKSVDDVQLSKVMNIAGSRGQTATYNFTRFDGAKSSLYVDVVSFKNQATMDSENITAGTGTAGKINNHPVYFMHAITLGDVREYRLLVVNGLMAYKFVIDQPVGNIRINEVDSLAVLKKVAEAAHLL